jgi:hypothetical protein
VPFRVIAFKKIVLGEKKLDINMVVELPDVAIYSPSMIRPVPEKRPRLMNLEEGSIVTKEMGE